MSSEVMTAIFTLLGTIFAGAGLKLIDSWLSRSSNRQQVDSELRGEYRETISDKRRDISELKDDITKAKIEINELEAEIDVWKERYYQELDAKTKLLAKLRGLEGKYKSE